VLLLTVLFLGLPLMSVVVAGLRADLLKLVSEPIFWRALATSAVMSLLGAAFRCCFRACWCGRAMRLSLGRREGDSHAARFFGGMGAASSLVLLVPPIVLATGWFLAVRNHRRNRDRGFGVLVVAINALMALPFVMRVLEPAYGIHQRRTQRLSASLGIRVSPVAPGGLAGAAQASADGAVLSPWRCRSAISGPWRCSVPTAS
jgi:thiamine transport system permease protein